MFVSTQVLLRNHFYSALLGRVLPLGAGVASSVVARDAPCCSLVLSKFPLSLPIKYISNGFPRQHLVCFLDVNHVVSTGRQILIQLVPRQLLAQMCPLFNYYDMRQPDLLPNNRESVKVNPSSIAVATKHPGPEPRFYRRVISHVSFSEHGIVRPRHSSTA